ncbi:MAG: DKNYY domain-containing protein, partial [Bdellovibrionota bacterium]
MTNNLMSKVPDIISAILILIWVGVPLATIMTIFNVRANEIPWSTIYLLLGLSLYPAIHGLIYYLSGRSFFAVSPGAFLAITAIVPVMFTLAIFPRAIYYKALNLDARVKFEGNQVFLNGKLVEKADPETFVLGKNGYSKDKNHVFFEYTGEAVVVDGADPQTFEAINFAYYKDAAKIFVLNEKMEVVDGADAQTFEPLGYRYAKDKQRIYWSGKPISEADLATFEVLKTSGPDDARDKSGSY